MSAPWGSPEANPLQDIREFMREAENLARQPREQFWVAAPTFRQALAWTHRNGVPLWQWQYISSPAGLAGLHTGTVVVVDGHLLSRTADWNVELHMLEQVGVRVWREYA